jgi:Endonuclease-reverse transcriptase
MQVLNVILDKEQWRIINFYHNVKDNTSLQALLDLDIEAVTPMLIIGDFNTHANNWSPPNIPQSPWANRLEEWATTNLLTLANNAGEITRRGAEHEKDLVIDLAWYNEAAVWAATFTDLHLDWASSLGSDHAMLRITGNPHVTIAITNTESNLGFLIDPEK